MPLIYLFAPYHAQTDKGEKRNHLSLSLVVAGAHGEPEDDLHRRARDGRLHRLALVDDGGVRRASEGLGQSLERVDAARDLAGEGGGVDAVALAEGEERGEGGQAGDGDGRAGEVARGRRDRGVGDGALLLLGPPDEACFFMRLLVWNERKNGRKKWSSGRRGKRNTGEKKKVRETREKKEIENREEKKNYQNSPSRSTIW